MISCEFVLLVTASLLLTSRVLQEERDKTKQRERIAIRISNIANMIILVAKVYACVKSRSLAIIASTLDSMLDLLSGFILWYTARSMRKQNPYLYPIGKKRMQPLVGPSILTGWKNIFVMSLLQRLRYMCVEDIIIMDYVVAENSIGSKFNYYCLTACYRFATRSRF